MAILELEKDGTVRKIVMNNGRNLQELDFARMLHQMVEEVAQDDEAFALVITSSDEKNWSQGFDLEWIDQQGGFPEAESVIELMLTLDQVYTKLMLMPCPTIAAVNGHAFGAGAFLATACDYRFMNGNRGYFCFPEIDLKGDFLPGVFQMMRHKLPDFKLPDMVLSGRRCTGTELEKFLIVEKACDSVDDTNNSAIEFAKTFNKDRKLIASYKRQLHGKAIEEMIALNKAFFGK